MVVRLACLLVRDTGEVKKYIYATQYSGVGIRLRQIQRQCRLPVGQGRTVFTQSENRMPASRKLLTKPPTDKSGGTAD
jgi:hypothetical protein